MDVLDHISSYIAAQPEPKRSDMQALHQLMLEASSAIHYGFNA
jgi:hypothetical protein